MPTPRPFPNFKQLSLEWEETLELLPETSNSKRSKIKKKLLDNFKKLKPGFTQLKKSLGTKINWQHLLLKKTYQDLPYFLGDHSNCLRLLLRPDNYTDQDHPSLMRLTYLIVSFLKTAYKIRSNSFPACQEKDYLLDMSAFERILGTSLLENSTQASQDFVLVSVQGLGIIKIANINLEHFTEENAPSLVASIYSELSKSLNCFKQLPLSPISNQDVHCALSLFCLDRGKETSSLPQTCRYFRDQSFDNRIFEKTLQIAVNKSAHAAVIYEHSAIDGHPINRFCKELYQEEEILLKQKVKYNSICNLSFEIFSFPSKAKNIKNSRPVFSSTLLKFKHLNQIFFKQHQISADGGIQTLLQMTAKDIFGSKKHIYCSEPVHMRHTHNGRYEEVVTTTQPLLDFLKQRRQFEKKSDKQNKQELKESLSKALDAHKNLIKKVKSSKMHGLLIKTLISKNKAFFKDAPKELKELLSPSLSTTNPGLAQGVAMPLVNDLPDKMSVVYAISEKCTLMALKFYGNKAKHLPAFAEKLKQNELFLKKLLSY